MRVHAHLHGTAEPIEPHSQVRHGRRRKGACRLPHGADRATALLALMLMLTLLLIRSRSAMPDAAPTRCPSACMGPTDASSQGWSVAQSQEWR